MEIQTDYLEGMIVVGFRLSPLDGEIYGRSGKTPDSPDIVSIDSSLDYNKVHSNRPSLGAMPLKAITEMP